MQVSAGKYQENRNRVAANDLPRRTGSSEKKVEFVDNRAEAAQFRKLQTIADTNPITARAGQNHLKSPFPSDAGIGKDTLSKPGVLQQKPVASRAVVQRVNAPKNVTQPIDRGFMAVFETIKKGLRILEPVESQEEVMRVQAEARGKRAAGSATDVLTGKKSVTGALTEQVTLEDRARLAVESVKALSTLGGGSGGDQGKPARQSSESSGSGWSLFGSGGKEKEGPRRQESGSSLLSGLPGFGSKKKGDQEKEKSSSGFSGLFESGGGKKQSQGGGVLGMGVGLEETGQVLKAGLVVKFRKEQAKTIIDEQVRQGADEASGFVGEVSGKAGGVFGKFSDWNINRKKKSEAQELLGEAKSMLATARSLVRAAAEYDDVKALYELRFARAEQYLNDFGRLISYYSDKVEQASIDARKLRMELERENPGDPSIWGKAEGFAAGAKNTLSSISESVKGGAKSLGKSAKETASEVGEKGKRTFAGLKSDIYGGAAKMFE